MKVVRTPTLDTPYVICTFFTSGELGRHYEEEFANLEASLEKHGYGDHLFAIDAGELAGWRKCTMLKPGMILMAMNYARRPVLWLDADARVMRRLDFFDHWEQEHGQDLGICIRSKDNSAWASGTMFWNYTSPAIELLTRWHNKAKDDTEHEGDQEILGFEATELVHAGRVTIKNLPRAYCCIFDRKDDLRMSTPWGGPIVMHHQASRRRCDGRIGGKVCRAIPPQVEGP